MTFAHLAESEKMRAALAVLVAARSAVVAGDEPIDSIQQAGGARIECHWARRLLAQVVGGDLLHWQQLKTTLKSDRTRAFDRAIRLARRALGHRGGWVVCDVGGAA